MNLTRWQTTVRIVLPQAWLNRIIEPRALRAPRLAKHPWVNSSTTSSIRNLRPSRVRSSTKCEVKTWLRCSGQSRIQEPSASHSRSTHVAFTSQSAARSEAVIFLWP